MAAAKMRSIRIGDEDWAAIGERAAAAGESVTAYLVRRALAPDSATRREVAALERELRDLRARVGEQLRGLAAEVDPK